MLKKTIADLKILREIINLHDVIFQMVNWYCTKDFQEIEKTSDKEIVINLDEPETLTKTLRLNIKVYEEFEQFCKDNNQYRKMDLTSMALKEYVENHKID